MHRLPDHITEAEILALIEGCEGMLDADRRDAVRAAVAADADLAAFVREMRADSSALSAISRVLAPSTVRAGVIAELQRPVPRLEVVREPEGGSIPISTVVVEHPNALQRFGEG